MLRLTKTESHSLEIERSEDDELEQIGEVVLEPGLKTVNFNNLISNPKPQITTPKSRSKLFTFVRMPNAHVILKGNSDVSSNKSHTVNSTETTYENKPGDNSKNGVNSDPSCNSTINVSNSMQQKKYENEDSHATTRPIGNYTASMQHQTYVTGKRSFSCSICLKKFSRPSELKHHNFTHTGEKPYKCTSCENSFRNKNTLKIHERLHTGEKPYKCNLCKKAFRQSIHLQLHERIHTGEKPYKYLHCERAFSCYSNMKAHTERHCCKILAKI